MSTSGQRGPADAEGLGAAKCAGAVLCDVVVRAQEKPALWWILQGETAGRGGGGGKGGCRPLHFGIACIGSLSQAQRRRAGLVVCVLGISTMGLPSTGTVSSPAAFVWPCARPNGGCASGLELLCDAEQQAAGWQGCSGARRGQGSTLICGSAAQCREAAELGLRRSTATAGAGLSREEKAADGHRQDGPLCYEDARAGKRLRVHRAGRGARSVAAGTDPRLCRPPPLLHKHAR